jgi:hypothetical protein
MRRSPLYPTKKAALNLAKYDDQCRPLMMEAQQPFHPFSMASYKRVAFNDHLLERFISKLDLNPIWIKSHPNYENLRAYGIIATYRLLVLALPCPSTSMLACAG